MNFEREYYENEAFWDPTFTRKGDLSRVGETAGMVPHSVTSVLDVGCGDGLFVRNLVESGRQFEKLIAVDRSRAALRHVGCRRALASIENLPFASRCFDLVTCLEVLEHLPFNLYDAGLTELARVAARYVLVSVPFRQDLERTLIGCPSCRSLFNPDYHLRSFDRAGLRDLLAARGFSCQAACPGGMGPRLLGVGWAMRLRGIRPGGVNPFNAAIPCPVCGFMLPAGERHVTTYSGARQGRVRRWVKSWWPKRMAPAWIAVLYARTP